MCMYGGEGMLSEMYTKKEKMAIYKYRKEGQSNKKQRTQIPDMEIHLLLVISMVGKTRLPM